MLLNSSETNTQTDVLMQLTNTGMREEPLIANTRVRELATWLRAVRSFFNVRNHALIESERTEILTRNFKCEDRIVRESMRHCLELLVELVGESHLSDEGETKIADGQAASLSLLEGDDAAPLANGNHENVVLYESFRTVYQFVDNKKEDDCVSFREWSHLGNILEPRISEAVSHLSASMEREAPVAIHARLLSLIEQITPLELGSELLKLFLSLSSALEYLKLIQGRLKLDLPLKMTLPIFALVREETRTALEVIEQRMLAIENLDSGIHEALDGTAYAIRIELRKSFEHELTGLSELQQPPHVYAKVETAHGLLRDCFQQSIVALGHLFDPTLDGLQLFDSFQTKLDQSLALRRDIWKLLQLVRRIEQCREESSLPSLLKMLGEFRAGSLRHLMYKDWESYERFADEVENARGATELAHVTHRFNAYLETLFGQIGMRAVLASHQFDPDEISV